jgi:hypothetical protein
MRERTAGTEDSGPDAGLTGQPGAWRAARTLPGAGQMPGPGDLKPQG